MKRRACVLLSCFALALFAAAPSLKADVMNGSFVDGFNGWSQFNGQVVSSLPLQGGGTLNPTAPPNLAYAETTAFVPFAFISQSGVDTGPLGSFLLFDYDFFTDEAAVTGADDALVLTITPETGPAQVIEVVSAQDAGLVANGPITAQNAGGFDRHTGFAPFIVDLTMFANQSVSLLFQATDRGNNAVTSGFALDNVRLQAVPEPSTMVLLGTSSVALVFGLRRRKKAAA